MLQPASCSTHPSGCPEKEGGGRLCKSNRASHQSQKYKHGREKKKIVIQQDQG